MLIKYFQGILQNKKRLCMISRDLRMRTSILQFEANTSFARDGVLKLIPARYTAHVKQ